MNPIAPLLQQQLRPAEIGAIAPRPWECHPTPDQRVVTSCPDIHVRIVTFHCAYLSRKIPETGTEQQKTGRNRTYCHLRKSLKGKDGLNLPPAHNSKVVGSNPTSATKILV